MRLATFTILAFAAALTAQAQIGWVKIGPDTPDRVFYSVWMIDLEHAVVVGDSGLIRLTTDGGTNWRTIPTGTQARLTRVRFTTPRLGYVSGSDGVLLKTTDGGNSWSSINTKQTGVIYDVIFFDEANGLIGGYAGLCRSTTDSGRTWTNRDIGFGPNNVYSFTFLNNKKGWACGNAGNVARTTNGGTSWQGQNSGKGTSLYSISFGSDSSGTMCSTGGLILHTTNGGKNWFVQYADVPISTYSLNEVQHLDGDRAYIVGYYGLVLLTTNGGKNWTPQDTPIQDFLEGMHFIDPKNGYAVGWKGAIVKTRTGGFLDADPAREAAVFSLSKLYPNPASSTSGNLVSIEFNLTRPGDVTASVWSPLGQQVDHIASGRYDAGTWNVRWQPRSLAPGTYYVRLQTASGVAVRSVVLR